MNQKSFRAGARLCAVWLCLVAVAAAASVVAGLLAKGRQAYLAGKNADAIALFDEALKVDPGSVEVKYMLGMVLNEEASQLIAAQNYQEAFGYLERLVQILPNDPEVRKMHELIRAQVQGPTPTRATSEKDAEMIAAARRAQEEMVKMTASVMSAAHAEAEKGQGVSAAAAAQAAQQQVLGRVQQTQANLLDKLGARDAALKDEILKLSQAQQQKGMRWVVVGNLAAILVAGGAGLAGASWILKRKQHAAMGMAASRVAEELLADHAELRQPAAQVKKDVPADVAIRLLIPFLDSADPRTQSLAGRTLFRYAFQYDRAVAVRSLENMARSREVRDRMSVVTALAELRAPEAVDILCWLAGDPDFEVQKRSLRELRRLHEHPDQLEPAVRQALDKAVATLSRDRKWIGRV